MMRLQRLDEYRSREAGNIVRALKIERVDVFSDKSMTLYGRGRAEISREHRLGVGSDFFGKHPHEPTGFCVVHNNGKRTYATTSFFNAHYIATGYVGEVPEVQDYCLGS